MDFLKVIFDKILSLFPTVFIITPYEAGVRFTFGKYYKSKGAGWYIIWPLIQRMVWMEVQTQVVDLRAQSIRTSDNVDLVVSGAVQYYIKDIERAVMAVQDVDVSLQAVSLGIILDYIKHKTLEEGQDIDSLK